MSDVSVGAYIRVIGRLELEATLGAPDPANRPEPQQFAYADRTARVMAVHFDRERSPSYRLEGLPGFWREAWLRPLTLRR